MPSEKPSRAEIVVEWEPSEIAVDISGKKCQESGTIHLGGNVPVTLKVRWYSGGGETIAEPPTVRVEFPKLKMEVGKFAPTEVRVWRVDGDVKMFELSGSEGSWSKRFTINIPIIPYRRLQIAFARAEAIAKDASGKTFRKVDWKPLYYGTVGECYEEGDAVVTVQNAPEAGGYVTAKGYTFRGVWSQHRVGVKSWRGVGTLRGESVRLVAHPARDYEFVHWEDGTTSPERTVELRVGGNYLFTAYYRKKAVPPAPPAPPPKPPAKLRITSLWAERHVDPEKRVVAAKFFISWTGGRPPYKVTLDPGDSSPSVSKTVQSTSASLEHAYKIERMPGVNQWTARVTVEDSLGDRDRRSKTIKVSITAPPPPPPEMAWVEAKIVEGFGRVCLDDICGSQRVSIQKKIGSKARLRVEPDPGWEFDHAVVRGKWYYQVPEIVTVRDHAVPTVIDIWLKPSVAPPTPAPTPPVVPPPAPGIEAGKVLLAAAVGGLIGAGAYYAYKSGALKKAGKYAEEAKRYIASWLGFGGR